MKAAHARACGRRKPDTPAPPVSPRTFSSNYILQRLELQPLANKAGSYQRIEWMRIRHRCQALVLLSEFRFTRQCAIAFTRPSDVMAETGTYMFVRVERHEYQAQDVILRTIFARPHPMSRPVRMRML